MTRKNLVKGLINAVRSVTDLKKHSSIFRMIINVLPYWITPNRITGLRYLMVIPLLCLIIHHLYWQALICFGFTMLLDAIDGALAEIRSMHSKLGAFIDPLADKIVVCGCLIALLPILPSVFIWTTIATCLFALSLTLIRIVKLFNEHGENVPANKASIIAKLPGKAKCWLEVLGIMIVLVGLEASVSGLVWTAFYLLLLAAVMGFASFWSQFKELLPKRQ